MPKHTVRLATVVTALLFVVPPLSAAAACSRNEHGVFEDGACASEALAKADKELNQVYRQLLGQLDQDAQNKLRTAQRAWVAYRDANATFVYAVEGDGSAGRMVAANQLEQATVARVKELRSWLR
jgi:uncharacterized protein YecT (DUF1311 family)